MASDTGNIEVRVDETLFSILRLECFAYECKFNNYRESKGEESNYCLLKKITISPSGGCEYVSI